MYVSIGLSFDRVNPTFEATPFRCVSILFHLFCVNPSIFIFSLSLTVLLSSIFSVVLYLPLLLCRIVKNWVFDLLICNFLLFYIFSSSKYKLLRYSSCSSLLSSPVTCATSSIYPNSISGPPVQSKALTRT